MTGTLAIVGVGPGAPDLMTLRAARMVEAADVVAYPETSRGSLAARIAAAHIVGERLPFSVPMSGDGAAEPAYDDAAARIGAALDAGRSVALLCEGDPMLYGSAASVMARLTRFPATIVPGVAAASACAAVAGQPLVRGAEPFTILPATAPETTLRAALAGPGALAIYKLGRHFDRVAALVRAGGRSGTYVARATLAEEVVAPLALVAHGPKPYFSTLLIPSRELPAGAADGRSGLAVGAVAVVVLGPSALATGRAVVGAIARAGRPALLHGLVRRVSADEVDVPFAETLHHIASLFADGTAIVGLCSSGILIRAVAPHLSDKLAEPPVLAVAEDGSAVVPLLGAHRGGTRLAAVIGEALGVRPGFTTQSEVRRGSALDDPPEGFVVADPGPFKALAADLAAGGGASPDPGLDFLDLPPGRTWIDATIAPPVAGMPAYVVRRVALGMGAERGAPAEAAVRFVRDALAAAGIDPRAVAVVATLDRKADEAAIHAVAADLGAPVRVFDTATLAAEEPRLQTPSEVVRAAVGVAGVAEAAALAAVGPAGRLVVPKTVRGPLTVALAAAPAPILPLPGRARGSVAVVGTGPGGRGQRTAETLALLAGADAFVGYTLYLDLVEDLRPTQARHDFALGDEEVRVRFALELAGTGRDVALVSSGDPGIYAMATLALELLDGDTLSDAAQRVELVVAPGISAAQAAAARSGAPLGHDFAYVSLSDLLTPWGAILARLEAVAAADFAVALYNPRSLRRTGQLEAALGIFRAARPPETPVVIAKSVGRPAEAILHTTLAAADPRAVDMLTTVIVGASSTRRFVRGDGRTWVYTPRGYALAPAEAAQ